MLDPVLQQAITDKKDELQVLTRLASIYINQDELLNSINGIPDLSLLNKLIPLKQEEIGLYGLLCVTPENAQADKTEKTAYRGDAVHDNILRFIEEDKKNKGSFAPGLETFLQEMRKKSEAYIRSLPKQLSSNNKSLLKELETLTDSHALHPNDIQAINQVRALIGSPEELTNLVQKTVYCKDPTKSEFVEKALSGLAEVVSLCINHDSVKEELVPEGFVKNFMTNIHQLLENIAKL